MHIADKDVYHGELAKIREAEEDCQRKIFELICELDENVQADQERVNTLRSMSDCLKTKNVHNEKEVKDKMMELINEADQNKSINK